jgi:Dolichyl-phosphate-mannose-protein mannosyltransferase
MTTRSIPRTAAAPRVSVSHLVTSVPIFVILALQTIVSLSLRNTAFQDEAHYLYAGRQIFGYLLGGPPPTEPYERYMSGLPYIQPLLAGALDTFGGLEAARMLSLGSMLFATTAVYMLTARLYDRDSAALAAALFAIQGSVLFLSRLATYDAMCLALLALAAVLALQAAGTRWLLADLLVGLVLLLAVATKYAGGLFVPTVLALLFLQTLHTRGGVQALLRTALPLLVMGAVVGLVLCSGQAEDVLFGLRASTTERIALFRADRFSLASQAAMIGGALFVLSAVGVLLSGWRRLPLALVLAVTALLAPAYHVYKAESISLHKHIAFGMFFAAPVAGYAVARLSGYGRGGLIGQRWMAGLAIVLVVFGLGLRQAQSFYAEWPDSTALVRVLRTQVRPGAGRILAEEAEVPRYYLQDVVSYWQWSHLYWFVYTDKAGQQLTGEAAYTAALSEGYFDLVVLHYGANANLAHAIDGVLRDGKQYEQIAKLPFETTFGQGYYWVWRKRAY